MFHISCTHSLFMTAGMSEFRCRVYLYILSIHCLPHARVFGWKRKSAHRAKSPILRSPLKPQSPHPLKTMLAARASTRNASRIVRNFATVVESAGVKVAAVDHGQPTSAVTFLVKAGSRFETKPGVAHALKNFAFKVRGGVTMLQS